MAGKRTISFRIHPRLDERFREATAEYYGKLGICFSAAVLMFLEAEPETQGEFLKRVFEAELNDEVEATVEAAKAEQLKRIKSRERGGPGKR